MIWKSAQYTGMLVIMTLFAPATIADSSRNCDASLTASPSSEFLECVLAGGQICLTDLSTCLKAVCTNFIYQPFFELSTEILPEHEQRPLSVFWTIPGVGYDSNAQQYGAGYYVVVVGAGSIHGCDE